MLLLLIEVILKIKVVKFMIKTDEIIQKIFDLKNLPFKKDTWIWWFWLFFFENPSNPEKPRQVAILWSTKNDASITCNDKDTSITKLIKEDGSVFSVVAAWYFDGEKMHENFLLDKVSLTEKGLEMTTSSPDTSFEFKKGVFKIVMSENMKFEAKMEDKGFNAPHFTSISKFGKGFEIIGINKLDLKAEVNGEKLKGTAYFQKITLNIPAPSWYWGAFHFKNNEFLSYFNPYVFGKSVRKSVSFYDGETMHRFDNLKIKKEGDELPVFHVRAKDKDKKIEFLVEAYSQAFWHFKKKKLKVVPINFIYNEYPSRITSFRFTDLKNNKVISEKDIGIGIGNSEHSTGILF